MSDTHNKGNSFPESSANKEHEPGKVFKQICPKCDTEIKFREIDSGCMKPCPKCAKQIYVMPRVTTGFKNKKDTKRQEGSGSKKNNIDETADETKLERKIKVNSGKGKKENIKGTIDSEKNKDKKIEKQKKITKQETIKTDDSNGNKFIKGTKDKQITKALEKKKMLMIILITFFLSGVLGWIIFSIFLGPKPLSQVAKDNDLTQLELVVNGWKSAELSYDAIITDLKIDRLHYEENNDYENVALANNAIEKEEENIIKNKELVLDALTNLSNDWRQHPTGMDQLLSNELENAKVKKPRKAKKLELVADAMNNIPENPSEDRDYWNSIWDNYFIQ